MTDQTKRHKHADLIIAWANGAKVQHKAPSCATWQDSRFPGWYPDVEYRIKPEPKPDIVWYANTYSGMFGSGSFWSSIQECNNSRTRDAVVAGIVRYTFDGETGKLKNVEIVQ